MSPSEPETVEVCAVRWCGHRESDHYKDGWIECRACIVADNKLTPNHQYARPVSASGGAE